MSRIAEASMPDLFGYPWSPGFKERTTSRDAAVAVKRRSDSLRERVYAVLRAAAPEGLTPDEAADLLRETVLAVRPRFSELAKADRIVPTGERRRNESNLKAKVWKVK